MSVNGRGGERQCAREYTSEPDPSSSRASPGDRMRQFDEATRIVRGRRRTLGSEIPVQTRIESTPPRAAKSTSVSNRSPTKTVRSGSN